MDLNNNQSSIESIANRVRKRKLTRAAEDDLGPLAEYAGILPSEQTDHFEDCVMLSRGGRAFLCNQCPFEAAEFVTVFRHLFAAHIFRCGRCSFYCTSRWQLRKHEQIEHNAFLDSEHCLDPLAVNLDPIGDGYLLINMLNTETVARLPSSRVPRLMNGLAGFVPTSIVTPIAIKNNPNIRPFEQVLPSQAISKPENSLEGYKCTRCDFVSLLLVKMKAHCAALSNYSYICPGQCHFGSENESEVRVHYFNCIYSNKDPKQMQPANFVNKDRKKIETFYTSLITEDDENHLNNSDDYDLMKQLHEPSVFVFKKSIDDIALTLTDELLIYSISASKRMYPKHGKTNQVPSIVFRSGLTFRSSHLSNDKCEELKHFLEMGHQFLLTNDEQLSKFNCPTEHSEFVRCDPLSPMRLTLPEYEGSEIDETDDLKANNETDDEKSNSS